MKTYVALLRAVNLGSRNKVAMSDLRALLSSLGHEDVQTYLQSGNAVFRSNGSLRAVTEELEAGLARELGVAAKVTMRTSKDLARMIEDNPLADKVDSPRQLHVAFLSKKPAPKARGTIDPAAFAPDELHFGADVVYLWYPNGLGTSKLNNATVEKKLGVDSTMRNWNTVTALDALAREVEQS